MNTTLERYVYDVTRRLPAKQRDEVAKELTANICDMLPADPTDAELEAVLTQLGDPRKLAEQYRQTPNYLIGPALYDDYIRMLPMIVTIVMLVGATVGGVLSVVDAVKADFAGNVAEITAQIIGRAIEMAFSGGLHALFWVTVGFAIADRTKAKPETAKSWTLADLPEEMPEQSGKISLADSVVELVLTVVGTAVLVAVCSNVFSGATALGFKGNLFTMEQVFAPHLLSKITACFVVCGLLGVMECVVKIVKRRWCVPVLVATLVSGTGVLAMTAYLALQAPFFKSELMEIIAQETALNFSLDAFFYGMLAIVAIITLSEMVYVAYKTRKTLRSAG